MGVSAGRWVKFLQQLNTLPQNKPLIKEESLTSCNWFSDAAKDSYLLCVSYILGIVEQRTLPPLAWSVWYTGPPECCYTRLSILNQKPSVYRSVLNQKVNATWEAL